MLWVLATSIFLLGYTFVGYPVLVWGWAWVKGRGVKRGTFTGGVSVLMAAHNEAGVLPKKIEQLLELAKKEPIREIWIGLDGCTDGTGERVKEKLN